jgi:hypothetical protein
MALRHDHPYLSFSVIPTRFTINTCIYVGSKPVGHFLANYYGQIDQDYINVTTIPFSNALWSPCSSKRSLNINSEVRIDNSRSRSRQGLFTIDSIDGQVTHLYGLSWRRCQ